ncbi:DUF1294 domain-containing protein [Massilia sp. NR 4-1]|uniref:DUF1294 domain-containing protein n=1 Tax=Massilia sp. NR 4-1 TaxID=1678028 RepID=UPI0012374EB8|nr:DUF1294 domain-containing protein [Massilia sp. NR 4-1]
MAAAGKEGRDGGKAKAAAAGASGRGKAAGSAARATPVRGSAGKGDGANRGAKTGGRGAPAKGDFVKRGGRADAGQGGGAAGAWGYLALPAFALLYLVAVLKWQLDQWPAAVYGAASVLAFIFYAIDKSAARSERWRTPESTLLLLGLACGWPGALLAQQWLRHKTVKTSFQLMFWASVLLNMAAFAAYARLQAGGVSLGHLLALP